ncbi:hypothetical protein GOARA_061_00520 [Gordonia araii NBRC 100433]|uniref:Facilitated glucose transporter n=1 Tax=Gordonia araii NBRC 100433 TaxID=1073574 RepID=G7H438_9ACTN|nr:hypothetical protein [Gordonia araii]NNG96322.1 facilitated glucose transporter [Gordonia araii NBRC 100433]GAB10613.1 hypothetical protein GOARA_061_00520 [Gordonia araii NBRC 100433]
MSDDTDIPFRFLFFIDGVVVGILSLGFLNLYIGSTMAPLGILAAAVGNALLVWLASGTVASPWHWAPVFGWGLVMALALGSGPGGDSLLVDDWRFAVLLFAGVGAPATVMWLASTRRRVLDAGGRDSRRAADRR